MREKAASSAPGIPMLLFLFVMFAASIFMLISMARVENLAGILASVAILIASSVSFGGLRVVNPNEAHVVTLFGRYTGSLRLPGMWWINPFSTTKRISMRVRNFESSKLKVNDADGNPIEIGAVVVWQVVDSAEALFQVDNYQEFMSVQSEAALRNLATSHPYDARDEKILSLRMASAEMNDALRHEVQSRLDKAGVQVVEARISHLAYAPEIAGAMLRRQQASAVVSARKTIVQGAVGMVEMALEELSKKHVVQLDEERKAAMVSNMLVVLCSEHSVQPVVNTGTLYH
ncbi:MAG: SPFH domain-containing protein [Candidatus Eisenbacteria bacterium]|uniref:SPFH domain-containing protein n=1 Tax=Eiseniibacteriota bacterium TaxID=2212470 RepID=A0A849SJ84_UNCEI|nr:SPFH domain-containing protein [Candidatus Eisenbacteria bacterium]